MGVARLRSTDLSTSAAGASAGRQTAPLQVVPQPTTNVSAAVSSRRGWRIKDVQQEQRRGGRRPELRVLLPRSSDRNPSLAPGPDTHNSGVVVLGATTVLAPPAGANASSAMGTAMSVGYPLSLSRQARATGSSTLPSAPPGQGDRHVMVYHGHYFSGAQHARRHALSPPLAAPPAASRDRMAAPGSNAPPATPVDLPPGISREDREPTPLLPSSAIAASRKRPHPDDEADAAAHVPSGITREILRRAGVPDRMAIQLPREASVRVALHMRRALGLDEQAFRRIHARYCRATAVPCSAEAFYLSLQNMCNAARRAPQLRTDFVEMLESDGLQRRYSVRLPRTVSLTVLTQATGSDTFGAMGVLEEESEQSVQATRNTVRERGLRLRMQDTLGYGYDARLREMCRIYAADSGVHLAPEQLYRGLLSLCYRADHVLESPRIELMRADTQAEFSAALQVDRIDRGLTLNGIRRYFVQLSNERRFVVLARTCEDPFDRMAILYSPVAQEIEEVVREMSNEVALGGSSAPR